MLCWVIISVCCICLQFQLLISVCCIFLLHRLIVHDQMHISVICIGCKVYFVGLMDRFVANYCQCFGSVLFDPDSAFWAEYQSESRALMTKKITTEKKNIFWSKIPIYLFLGLHKARQSYRRSSQPSKENIQHFKTWNFKFFFYIYGSFLPSWIRIRIPNRDFESGYRSKFQI